MILDKCFLTFLKISSRIAWSHRFCTPEELFCILLLYDWSCYQSLQHNSMLYRINFQNFSAHSDVSGRIPQLGEHYRSHYKGPPSVCGIAGCPACPLFFFGSVARFEGHLSRLGRDACRCRDRDEARLGTCSRKRLGSGPRDKGILATGVLFREDGIWKHRHLSRRNSKWAACG